MKSPPVVSRATLSDISLARQAVAEVHGRTPVDYAALAAFLSDPACYLIIAVEEDRVVGSLGGHALRHPHRPEPQFLLYEIDVRPECRNRGIGRALVTKFSAEARAAGAFEVWVLTNQSNPAALAVYRACGYRSRDTGDVMLAIEL